MAKDGNKLSFELDSLNQVNGQYQMTLVGSNGAAGKTISWELGTINVWFKEGQKEMTNNHILESFLPQEEVKASYPPPDYQGKLIVSGGVSALLVAAFFRYTWKQSLLQTVM